jgi:hypothetical protein
MKVRNKELYKSPIEKIYGELQTQMVQEDENMVMKAIRKVGVNVDKETLIEALQYDRNQYTKGYENGKNDILDEIKAEIDGIEINGQVDINTMFIRTGEQVKQIVLNIIDKYKAGSEVQDADRN